MILSKCWNGISLDRSHFLVASSLNILEQEIAGYEIAKLVHGFDGCAANIDLDFVKAVEVDTLIDLELLFGLQIDLLGPVGRRTIFGGLAIGTVKLSRIAEVRSIATPTTELDVPRLLRLAVLLAEAGSPLVLR